MTTSVRSPEDVINLALTRIGYKQRIANIREGTPAAAQALNIYAQTRDELLRSNVWGFAERIAAATLSGGIAPFPWPVEYLYPADALQIRNIFDTTYPLDPNNPRPVLYQVGNSANGTKIIWAQVAGATLVYTTRLTDPVLWEPLFVELLSVELGKRLALGLTSADVEKLLTEDEKAIAPLAEGTIG